ncbi:MAG: hypothetical protein Kow0090_00090 [Myxococcota bacterium]
MNKVFYCLLAALLVWGLFSCGGEGSKGENGDKDTGEGGKDDDDDSATESCNESYFFGKGASFDFYLSGSSPDFDDMPFPNDLFLGDDGRVNLNTMPDNGGRPDRNYSELLRTAVNSLDGFGVSTGVFFPIPVDIDKSSIPSSTLEIFDDDKVLFFELGGDYPRVPTSVFYADKNPNDDDGGRLVVHPALGFILKEKTKYAVVVKKGMKTSSGEDVVISEELAKALTGCGDERVNEVYKPLSEWLKMSGIPLEEIVAATVFTTQTITADLLAIHRQAIENPLPAPQLHKAFPNEEASLSDVLGKEEPYGFLLQGIFVPPRYASKSKEILGVFEYDNNGEPKAKGSEEIIFTLLLPRLGNYNNLPLVVFQHGLNGSRTEVFMFAEKFISEGFAIACIDTPYHGSRAIEAYDEKANRTGKPIPDGFGDDVGGAPALNFTGVSGTVEEGLTDLHPFITRDNFRQAASDLFYLISTLLDGDLSELKAVAPELDSLSFDSENVFFIGQSFGSIIGTIFNGVEDRVKGAVLNVGGIGMIFPTLMGSYGFSKLFGPILYNKIGLNYFKIDYELNPPESEPWVNLFQMALEPGDPLGYARHIALALPPGKSKPVNLLIQHAYNDQTVPNRANEAQSKSAGVPYVKANGKEPKLRYIKAETLAGSAKENLNGVTAAASQFDPATHDMLGSTSGDVYVEEEFPPFKALEGGTKTISNPKAEVQKQILDFYLSCLSGECVISDPYEL